VLCCSHHTYVYAHIHIHVDGACCVCSALPYSFSNGLVVHKLTRPSREVEYVGLREERGVGLRDWCLLIITARPSRLFLFECTKWLFMCCAAKQLSLVADCAVKVIRRPYMFVYRSEKDHQELDVINVASALIEFSEETTSMIRVPYALYLIRCLSPVSTTRVDGPS